MCIADKKYLYSNSEVNVYNEAYYYCKGIVEYVEQVSYKTLRERWFLVAKILWYNKIYIIITGYKLSQFFLNQY